MGAVTPRAPFPGPMITRTIDGGVHGSGADYQYRFTFAVNRPVTDHYVLMVSGGTARSLEITALPLFPTPPSHATMARPEKPILFHKDGSVIVEK